MGISDVTVAAVADAGLSEREETASSVPDFGVEVGLGVGVATGTDIELVAVAEGAADTPLSVLGPAAASVADEEETGADGSMILIGTRRRLGAVAESADEIVGGPGASGVLPLTFCRFKFSLGFYVYDK